MGRLLLIFLRTENGATAIEYGLIAALIAVIAIVGITAAGGSIKGMFNYVSNTAGVTTRTAARMSEWPAPTLSNCVTCAPRRETSPRWPSAWRG